MPWRECQTPILQKEIWKKKGVSCVGVGQTDSFCNAGNLREGRFLGHHQAAAFECTRGDGWKCNGHY
uniref:Uncharacterized protein n=1 Tax=Physcomitrium patens TaxID=3218 RepID=A0A2K1IJY4_PHYPA|nr:hypothetical protein PHYPA_028283 [Physcomitrium patens]